jgi:hypothetical protein
MVLGLAETPSIVGRGSHVESGPPRHAQAKPFGSFYVDSGFVFGRRLYGKVSGFVAPQDAVYIGRRQTKIFDRINSVGHQAPGFDKKTARVDRQQSVTGCKRDDENLSFDASEQFRNQLCVPSDI